MTEDAGAVAATYFRAWKEKDFTMLRSVLADDASFRGPLGKRRRRRDLPAGPEGNGADRH